VPFSDAPPPMLRTQLHREPAASLEAGAVTSLQSISVSHVFFFLFSLNLFSFQISNTPPQTLRRQEIMYLDGFLPIQNYSLSLKDRCVQIYFGRND
jgi:hypothetical protein